MVPFDTAGKPSEGALPDIGGYAIKEVEVSIDHLHLFLHLISRPLLLVGDRHGQDDCLAGGVAEVDVALVADCGVNVTLSSSVVIGYVGSTGGT